MAKPSASSNCLQHPGFQAIGRCKQCGKPFCSQCQIQGPTGVFCRKECQNAHEVFIQRAAQLDSMTKGTSIIGKLIGGIKTLLGLAILATLIGAIAHYFSVDVPVISEFLNSISE